MLELFPHAQTFHLGLFRDKHNFTPTEYYSKLPSNLNERVDIVYLLDPVVATGGTACAAVAMLQGMFSACLSCFANPRKRQHPSKVRSSCSAILCTYRCRSTDSKHQAPMRDSFNARPTTNSLEMPWTGDLRSSGGSRIE